MITIKRLIILLLLICIGNYVNTGQRMPALTTLAIQSLIKDAVQTRDMSRLIEFFNNTPEVTYPFVNIVKQQAKGLARALYQKARDANDLMVLEQINEFPLEIQHAFFEELVKLEKEYYLITSRILKEIIEFSDYTSFKIIKTLPIALRSQVICSVVKAQVDQALKMDNVSLIKQLPVELQSVGLSLFEADNDPTAAVVNSVLTGSYAIEDLMDDQYYNDINLINCGADYLTADKIINSYKFDQTEELLARYSERFEFKKIKSLIESNIPLSRRSKELIEKLPEDIIWKYVSDKDYESFKNNIISYAVSGLSLNSKSEVFDPPIIFAMKHIKDKDDLKKVIKLLVEFGADIQAINMDQQSVFQFAQDKDMQNFLIGLGAQKRSFEPLYKYHWSRGVLHD